MTDHVYSQTTESLTKTSALAQTVLAALLGAFILFGTGFVQISAAHNAAHDSRHSLAFPCH
ncbi:MAG: CbtB domain-containing protein [Rhodospirillales bacterium]|jgi:cobalt transporter subunit CbtB|nr:CbtB domain-containing protein [Rhodospirillales bacterium]MDP7650497.1 CbtB domain-containing protein [Rhodospirillales bacterium]HJO96717.1 CbtB domain-containing protein [Rhodospirillales bacterium]